MRTSEKMKAAHRLVSPIFGEWTSPPALIPHGMQSDGPLLGNGDFGATLGGEDGLAVWHMAKVDFWEARYYYPQGGPRPTACLRITGPEGGWYARQDIYTAEVTCLLGAENAPRLEIRGFVSAMENLFVVRLKALGGHVEGSVELSPHATAGSLHDRSVIERGTTDLSHYLYRGYTDEGVDFPSEIMTAMRMLPQDIMSRYKYGKPGENPVLTPLPDAVPFSLDEGEECCAVISACTNHDAVTFRRTAIEKVESLEDADIPMLERLHRSWWERFYARSWVEFDDELLMRYYYASFYTLASCSRNDRFPPGLLGLWITSDAPGWASDFHFNYNHQAPWWACYTAGQLELTEPYDRPMMEFVPRARDNARKYEGCRGVYFDVGIGPQGFITSAETNVYEDDHYFLGQKSNAGFIAVNMIMRWRKTMDLNYAAKIYSFLRDVVLFYQDYADFEDGVYNIYRDTPSEVEIFTWRLKPASREALKSRECKNNPQPLAFLRMTIPVLLELSERLDLDADLRDNWKDFLEHLAPYPAYIAEDGKRYFTSSANGGFWNRIEKEDVRHSMHIVFPSGMTGPGSDPVTYETAQNTFARYADQYWFHFNFFSLVYPAAARLGYDPEVILRELANQCTERGYRNMWTFHGGGGIEDLSAVPNTIQEMLLQSYEGTLRLVPNWPRGKAASFAGWIADGAFEVDASYDGEKVTSLMIRSLAGEPLRLENPWPGYEIEYRCDGETHRLTGNILHISTDEGQTLTFHRV